MPCCTVARIAGGGMPSRTATCTAGGCKPSRTAVRTASGCTPSRIHSGSYLHAQLQVGALCGLGVRVGIGGGSY